MIVCICNRLNSADVTRALTETTNANEVHRVCGCEVQCGCCMATIEEMADECVT